MLVLAACAAPAAAPTSPPPTAAAQPATAALPTTAPTTAAVPTTAPTTAAPAATTGAPTTAAQTPAAAPKAPTGRLEIFSWWTTGGEAAGLLKLYDIQKKQSPTLDIVNATVAGGAGSNAKAVLKTRMLGGDPPDSFQVHMGHELIDTWVTTGFMDNLDDLYKSEGWEQLFPKGVLDIISFDGHYWSVPANIHRANVLWYNQKTFADNSLQPPKSFDEFFTVADTLKGKGVTPLALGDNGIWASTHLFETVLIGTLGPDKYNGLWTGQTDWKGPEVTQALENFKRMLSYVNADHSSLSWDQANELVLNGTAAMTIMGDWVDADNLAKNKADVEGWAPAPGTSGVYDALSDTFGLPKNAKNRDAALSWLRLVGSKEGQEAFNPVKGSICARTDCDPSLFGPYLKSAMQDWQRDTIVPSLAHGAAASEGWVTAINDIMTVFVTRQDVASAQASLAQACIDAQVCK
jgi:glucose/mannose transport system substrate-binding protein